jgi:DNA-binding XRE family transcriptional regulator
MNSIVSNEELGRRVRRLRAERQLTLKQVEEACGLSATHLSEIERGRTCPTIGALTRIAQALGRAASYFVEAEELPDVAHLPRGGHAGFVAACGTRVEPLTSGVPGSHLFAYRLGLGAPPAGPFMLAGQEHPGEALYFVRQGCVETVFGGTRLTLGPGDAAQSLLSCDHALRALDGSPAEVVALLTHRIEEWD